MKLSKSMAYYFTFWIIYLPLTIVFSLLFNLKLEMFLSYLGIGALLLLAFLSVRFLIYKLKSSKPTKQSNSETSMPKDNLEQFRQMFNSEVLNETQNNQ